MNELITWASPSFINCKWNIQLKFNHKRLLGVIYKKAWMCLLFMPWYYKNYLKRVIQCWTCILMPSKEDVQDGDAQVNLHLRVKRVLLKVKWHQINQKYFQGKYTKV